MFIVCFNKKNFKKGIDLMPEYTNAANELGVVMNKKLNLTVFDFLIFQQSPSESKHFDILSTSTLYLLVTKIP